MIRKFGEFEPQVDSNAYIHESAEIIGRVRIEKDASVWPHAVLRGDVDRIDVGEETNVQDLCVLHPNYDMPVRLGRGITVGHSAVIHGSVVGDFSLIGMGAVVIDSEVGEYTIIGAGALVPPNSKIPSRTLVLGVPAKVIRKLTEDEIKGLIKSKDEYLKLANSYGR